MADNAVDEKTKKAVVVAAAKAHVAYGKASGICDALRTAIRRKDKNEDEFKRRLELIRALVKNGEKAVPNLNKAIDALADAGDKIKDKKHHLKQMADQLFRVYFDAVTRMQKYVAKVKKSIR